MFASCLIVPLLEMSFVFTAFRSFYKKRLRVINESMLNGYLGTDVYLFESVFHKKNNSTLFFLSEF